MFYPISSILTQFIHRNRNNMTLTYFNDINVYFHMKNHYKMLKQVKSVIDTSLPQSLLKSPVAMPRLQKRWKGNTNEELRKIYNSPIYMPKRVGQVKRHNCLNSEAKSEISLRTGSIPPRPITRRNPAATPKENSARSSSVGPRPTTNENMFRFRHKKRPSVSSTRSSNTENQSTNVPPDSEKGNAKGTGESPQSIKISSDREDKNCVISEGHENSPKPKTDNNFFKESSEEHEYLLFLLRITEDIIVNDFYSNNDIKQVFKFHIEANKHRLNVRKMRFHIGNLCKELNIDCPEYQNENTEKNEEESALKFKNFPEPQRSCYLNNEAFLNCLDCSAIRTSSLYKMASLSHVTENSDGGNGDNETSISPSLLRLLEKLSLGRVTECTEPAASTSTINSPTRCFPNDFDKEGQIGDDKDDSPIDFDTFVKELHSNKEDNLVLQNKNEGDKSDYLKQDNILAAVSPPMPVEVYTALVIDKAQENADLIEKQSYKSIPSDLTEKRSSKILPTNFLSTLKLSSKEGSKSEIEISDKGTKSMTSSDKYDSSDFEKSSSYHSFTKSVSEDKLKRDEKIQEENIQSIQSDEDKLKKDERTPENNIQSVQSVPVVAVSDKIDDVQSDEDKLKKDEETPEKNIQSIQSVPVVAGSDKLEVVQSEKTPVLISRHIENNEDIHSMKTDTVTASNDNGIPSMENNTATVQDEDAIIILMDTNSRTLRNTKPIPSIETNTKTVKSNIAVASKDLLPISTQKQHDQFEDFHDLKRLESKGEFIGNSDGNSILFKNNQFLANNVSKCESSFTMSAVEIDKSNNQVNLANNKSCVHISPPSESVKSTPTNMTESLDMKIPVLTDQMDLHTEMVSSNVISNNQLQDKIEHVVEEGIHNQIDSGQSLVTIHPFKKSSQLPVKVTQPKTISIFSLESSRNTKTSSANKQKNQIESNNNSNASKQDDKEQNPNTLLKVILQGSLTDGDFIMIKGPVYVYKPLLESEPKLVVFNDENYRKSRRNSADSQRSNRTFTIANSPVREQLDADQQVDDLLIDSVDEAVQFDHSLHSLVDDSMENILELTRRAYNQFTDSKLLQSDYDLMPQKDLDHKYHHLMVDATSSVSGVNIKESLLLTDDYLVEHDTNQQILNVEQQVLSAEAVKDEIKDVQIEAQGDRQHIKDIDSYLKFDSKFFNNNCNNRNRKLLASASMPKLMTMSDTSEESVQGRINRCRNGELLMGYTTDLMNFDIPSQDSSLRSEGETYQNEKPKRGVPWSTYFN